MNKLAIRPAEAAELLSISPRKFNQMRASGQLPHAVKLGGCLLYRLDDLHRWLQLDCPSGQDFAQIRGAK